MGVDIVVATMFVDQLLPLFPPHVGIIAHNARVRMLVYRLALVVPLPAPGEQAYPAAVKLM